MVSVQGIEQLFKMCHDFKEHEMPKNPKAKQPYHCPQHAAAKVEELIKQLKGQVEPLQH